MVMVDGKYFDGYLKDNLDILIKAVDLKWDGVLYLSGYEGDGKSTLASQICWYLDRDFSMKNVVFNGEQFMHACLNAKPKQAILFDEAYLAFTNKSIASKEARFLTSMLTMIRKKQLFIIIVAPTFFDIQKYIAIHRSRALIHVYSVDLKRGYFGLFNRKTKHKLYMKGKRDNNIYAVKPNLTGSFGKWFPLDEVEYDARKEEAIQEFTNLINAPKKIIPMDEIKTHKLNAQTEFVCWLRSKALLKNGAIKTIAEDYFDIARTTLYDRFKPYNKQREE